MGVTAFSPSKKNKRIFIYPLAIAIGIWYNTLIKSQTRHYKDKERQKTMKKLMVVSTALLAMAYTAMGNTIDKASTLLKGFEGFRPSVYKCEAGKDTIGYGFTSKELIAKGRMTEAEASAELKRICEGITIKLRNELGNGNTLTASEEAAIVSFIYNVGWYNFKTSTLCRLLKEGRRGAIIGVELRKWVYVTKGGKKVVSKGLVRRRDKEVMTFLIG